MAQRIDLKKTNLVEVVGMGLILEVSEDDMGRVLVRVESEEGGNRIIIKQHEEEARCIVFSVDRPSGGSHLSLVKE